MSSLFVLRSIWGELTSSALNSRNVLKIRYKPFVEVCATQKSDRLKLSFLQSFLMSVWKDLEQSEIHHIYDLEDFDDLDGPTYDNSVLAICLQAFCKREVRWLQEKWFS